MRKSKKNRVRRPTKAKLCGQWFTIRYVGKDVLSKLSVDINGEPDEEEQYTRHGQNLLGLCVKNDKHRNVYILDSLKGRLLLDTTIHELIHACQWYMGEEAVEQIANDISRVLWNDGWRRPAELSDAGPSDRKNRQKA